MNLRFARKTGGEWSQAQIAVAIFLLAFFVRVVVMLATQPYNQPLRVEIHHLAYSIAEGQGYANPYRTPTGPTALYSPGCPLLLAGIYRLLGTGSLGEAGTYLLNVAAASATFALLPLLSVWLGFPRRVGIAAAVAGALVPVYLLNEYRSITAVFAGTCLASLTLLTAWMWRQKRSPTVGLGTLCGLAWGCALLFAPNLLLVGLLWLVEALLHYRVRAAGFGFAALVIAILVLSPWAIRNQRVLGSAIFARSNFGLELWIANNDVSAATYAENARSQTLYQPFINSHEANQIRVLGEAAYMRQKMNAAVAWIRLHPSRFVALSISRIFYFWFPITFRPIQTIAVCGLTTAGLIGLAFSFVRNRSAFWILASIWLAYPLVYYVVQLDNPYRYPIYWSVLLLAAYGCISIVDLARNSVPARISNSTASGIASRTV